MESVIRFLENNPAFIVLGFLGSLASIVGIPLAVYFGRDKRKKLMYRVANHSLIRNYKSIINKLCVIYNNSEIESLNVMYIYFWNAGKTIINKSDIYKEKPITFYVDSDSILDVSIVAEAESTCNFNISKVEDNYFCIEFDDIESLSGAKFQVFYTGTRKADIKVEGKIRNNGSICKYSEKSRSLVLRVIGFILFLASIITSIFISSYKFGTIISDRILMYMSNNSIIRKEDIENIISATLLWEIDVSSLMVTIALIMSFLALYFFIYFLLNRNYKKVKRTISMLNDITEDS